MSEISAAWNMLPPSFVGVVFLILGLVIGSFSSVLQYRLPRREDFVASRSHCPNCEHALSPLDLVPVLSFLWLRGACRYCGHKISWRYPALELGCGVAAGWSAMVWGPGAGVAVLGLWIAAHVVSGLGRRPAAHPDQSGSMLVEVLIGTMLLGIVLAPIYDAVRTSLAGRALVKNQAVMIGLAREDLAGAVTAPASHPPELHVDSTTNTTFSVARAATPLTASPPNTNVGAAAITRYKVTVTVTCTSCRPFSGAQPSLVLSEVVVP